MLSHAHDPRNVSIAPVVIAAALDCLACCGDLDPIAPDHMHLIAKALGCRDPEASALTMRLVAFAAVLQDVRWSSWMTARTQLACDGRRNFDIALTQIVADTALDARGRFNPDAVFENLLHIVADPRIVELGGGGSSCRH